MFYKVKEYLKNSASTASPVIDCSRLLALSRRSITSHLKLRAKGRRFDSELCFDKFSRPLCPFIVRVRMDTQSYMPVPPGIGMEENYFSLDDILLSHERLPCRTECAFPRLGFLEKSSDTRDIPEVFEHTNSTIYCTEPGVNCLWVFFFVLLFIRVWHEIKYFVFTNTFRILFNMFKVWHWFINACFV